MHWWMSLLTNLRALLSSKDVKIRPYLLYCLRAFLTMNGPKQFMPLYVKGAEASRCSLGSSAIRWLSVGRRSFLQNTRVCIRLATNLLPPMTQNPFVLSSFCVWPRPWWHVLAWQWDTISLVMWLLFGKMTGWLTLWQRDDCFYPYLSIVAPITLGEAVK